MTGYSPLAVLRALRMCTQLFDRLLALVQTPIASLVANPTTTAVPERSLQQSEILKNRKGVYRKRRKLGATKSPSIIASSILLNPAGARKSGTQGDTVITLFEGCVGQFPLH